MVLRVVGWLDGSLREVSNEDLPLIRQWLQAEHVRNAWGDPQTNFLLLSEPAAQGAWRAIIQADGREVGLVLWQHPSRDELDAAGLADIPTSAIDIDIMIGEPTALGLGFGSSAIRQVAEAALSDPKVPFVMACARWDNLASQRAFAKAGFRTVRQFDDVPNGRYVLMVRDRSEAAEPAKTINPFLGRLLRSAGFRGASLPWSGIWPVRSNRLGVSI